jgi:hypothetical protein
MVDWTPQAILVSLMVGNISGALLTLNGKDYFTESYNKIVEKCTNIGNNDEEISLNKFDEFSFPFFHYVYFTILAFLLGEIPVALYLYGYLTAGESSTWAYIGNNIYNVYLSSGFFFLAIIFLLIAMSLMPLTYFSFKLKELFPKIPPQPPQDPPSNPS